MKRFLIMMSLLLSAALAEAQTGLKINDLFEGRIIPQERMIETRVRGKTLAKYQLSYYRSVRFTVGESEAERVLKIVEDDSKDHFASGGNKSRKTVFGKEHSINYKTQVGRQDDRNCFLCYQAWWRGNTSEREVTVIYMEGSVKSLEQLEELLNND